MHGYMGYILFFFFFACHACAAQRHDTSEEWRPFGLTLDALPGQPPVAGLSGPLKLGRALRRSFRVFIRAGLGDLLARWPCGPLAVRLKRERQGRVRPHSLELHTSSKEKKQIAVSEV